jgi:hypothetical protein
MHGIETTGKGRVLVIRWTDKPTVEIIRAATQAVEDACRRSGGEKLYYLGVVTNGRRFPNAEAVRALIELGRLLSQRCKKVRYVLELEGLVATMVRTTIDAMTVLAGLSGRNMFSFSKSTDAAMREFANDLGVDVASLLPLAQPGTAA